MREYLRSSFVNTNIFYLLGGIIFGFIYINTKSTVIYYGSLTFFSLCITKIRTLKIFLFYISIGIFVFLKLANYQNVNQGEIFDGKITGLISGCSTKQMELINANLNNKALPKRINLVINEIGSCRSFQSLEIVGKFKVEKVSNTNIKISDLGSKSKLNSNIFSDSVYRLKDYVNNIFEIYFQSNSGLAKSMIFGLKDDLEKDQSKIFTNLGLSHVLVASGANIILIVEVVNFIFSKMRIRGKNVTIFSILFIYFGMIGIQGSFVRAFVFFLVGFIESKILGRKIDRLEFYIFSFVIVLWFFPFIIFELSFLLSMLAVLCINFSSSFLKFLQIENSLIKAIITNTLITLIVNLFIAYYFKVYNLNGLLSNLLILYFVELIVMYGFGISLALMLTQIVNARILFQILKVCILPLLWGLGLFQKAVGFLNVFLGQSLIIKLYINFTHLLFIYLGVSFIWIFILYRNQRKSKELPLQRYKNS
jgi:ComEC/Rec2-related protein